MPGERLLIIDDEAGLREFMRLFLSREGYEVHSAASGEVGLELYDRLRPDLVLTDLTMPGMNGLEVLRRVKERAAREGRDVPVLLITAYGSVQTAVEAMREGAFDYLPKPFVNEDLRMRISKALAMRSLAEENARMRAELGERYQLGQMVGSSPKMQQVYALIRRVMGTRINCLIIGESGTGKELVARAIHWGSDRAQKPFVAVNCGAIPESLFESELFGHKRGSFTGANRDKDGLFQAAHGGTLFLDEIGEMPLAMQVKVLRALAERRITMIGDTREIAVDVRVVAATNRDLDQERREGRFREDLYYRLNVVQIDLPPLRDRAEDVPALAQHYLDRYAREYGKPLRGFTPEAMGMLRAYRFPGNVRELQNLMERAVVLEAGSLITPGSLPGRVQGEIRDPDAQDPAQDPAPADPNADPQAEVEEFRLDGGIDLEARLNSMERRYLEQALKATHNNYTQAARLLGVTFRSFRYRLAKYNLNEE